MSETKKCAHPACSCKASAEHGSYCSEYCHDAGNTTEISCNCGHPHCELELEPQTAALVS